MASPITNIQDSINGIERLITSKKNKQNTDMNGQFKIYQELKGKVGKAFEELDELASFFENVKFDDTKPDKSIDIEYLEEIINANKFNPNIKEILSVMEKLYNIYYSVDDTELYDNMEEDVQYEEDVE